MKHTKGEWVYDLSNVAYTAGAITFGTGRLTIGEIYGPTEEGMTNPEEMEANAKLIAAAPDMLEALLTTAEAIMRGPTPNEALLTKVINEVQAAIKKATR